MLLFTPRKHPFDTLGYSPQDADYIQDNIPFIRPPPICIHRPRADPELNTLQKYFMCTRYHKCIVHQYVFTVPEQTQNRVHSKYKTYYVSQNVLCTNMYSPAQSGIEQPNAKETELLISISFKVLEFSGFSLALAYFLSHFLLMPHFKRNWSLSDWQSATCCDML